MRTALRGGRDLLPAAALALAAALTLAGPLAQAHAGQFLLTTAKASEPSVAVDSSGTGHFAWEEGASGGDILHYCQVPRGAHACAVEHSFPRPVPEEEMGNPRVLLGSQPGQVLLLSYGCCYGYPAPTGEGYVDETLWLYSSSDDGRTFSSPRLIGTNQPDGGAMFGPGEFAISTINTDGRFQSALTDGFTYATASLGPPGLFEGAEGASAALIDQSTPIVAYLTPPAGGASYHAWFRVWGGSGDYNDPASWRAPVSLGPAEGVDLVGGPRGVYMFEDISHAHPHATRTDTLVARHFDGSTFGTPVQVSGRGEELISGVYAEDQAGGLDVVGCSSSTHELTYRHSSDGVHWPLAKLVSGKTCALEYTDLAVGACAPGDGFAAWSNLKNNGAALESGLHAVALGTNRTCGSSAASSPPCPTEVQFGEVHAVATSGCFARRKRVYRTRGAVLVNGLRLAPAGGATITIDAGAHTLTSSGSVTVAAATLKLARERLDWLLPPAGGRLLQGDGSGNPVALNIGALHQRVLDLPVVGTITPELSAGRALLPANVQLPSPVGSLLGGAATLNHVPLRVSNAAPGLNLGLGFHLHLDEASLGIAELKPVDLNYTATPDVLSGKIGIVLPVGGTIRASIEFRQGSFVDADADYMPSPPIALAGAPPSAVFLSDINLHTHKLTDCQHPTEIAGGIGLTGGPPVGGRGLLGITGEASYKFPQASCKLPGVFRIEGHGTVGGFPIASAYVQYETTEKLTFGGGVDLSFLPIARLAVNVNGGIDFANGDFFAEGSGLGEIFYIPVASAKVIISNIGVGGCASAFGVSLSLRYHWGHGATVSSSLDGCGLSDLKPVAFAAAAGTRGPEASAAAGASFRIAHRVPYEEIAVFGSSGSPALTLDGPHGTHIATSTLAAPVATASYSVLPIPARNVTLVKLEHPALGRWTVGAQPGSSAIARVATAQALPAPHVHAKVRRARRGGFRLSYRLRSIPGQRVRFIERAGEAASPIAVAHGTHGTIRLHPAPGPGGRRTVMAIVEERGTPRAELQVARFTAVPPRRPSRPRRLRLRRSHGGLLIGWRAARGAARYVVDVALRDGRRLERSVRSPHARIGDVPGIDAARVRVAGVGAGGQPGPVASARLRSHPNRPCSQHGKLPPSCRHRRRHGRHHRHRHRG